MAGQFLHLELDESGISGLVVEDSFRKTSVRDSCRILYTDLPDTDRGEESRLDAVLTALASRIRLENCATALILIPSTRVSYRVLSLPFRSEKKIRQVLPMELSSRLPLDQDTYISDIIIPGKADGSGLFPVLTASVPAGVVDRLFSSLGRIGIVPKVIAPGGYAVARGALKLYPKVQSFILLSIGYHEATITIMENRIPMLVRSFDTNGFDCPHSADELEKTVKGFLLRTGTDTTFDCFVSSVFSGRDHSPVFESARNMTQVSVPDTGVMHPSGISSALSISRDTRHMFNFCQGRYGNQAFLKRYSARIAGTAALAASVFILSVMGIQQDISVLESRVAEARRTASGILKETFPNRRDIGDPLLQMQSLLKEARDKSGGATGPGLLTGTMNHQAVIIINELSRRVSEDLDIDISRLLLSHGRLTLAGSTDNFNTVDRIKNSLEGSKIFRKVDIGSAAASKSGDRIMFKFMIEL